MEKEDRNKFVDLEAYLIPETRILLAEINSQLPHPKEVLLRKVYNSEEPWQVRKCVSYHIDMPERDEGNLVSFSHELLHIYFAFCQGMKLSDTELLSLIPPYNSGYKDPWYLPNHFINLINHLQHHKMVPYFDAFNFPLDKIIVNFENPVDLLETFDNNLKTAFDLEQPAHRYTAALGYVNFLTLELYFPNPAVRKELRNKYSLQYDKKFVGLRSIFQPVLEKWNTEYNGLRQLIFDINVKAKEYAKMD